ncbi:MAG TPA: nitroreductase family deazaflavin-dependent oxidoreductase [Actinomycetota bacterium]|nr:nitroreductase family deazaflavin-dependent oxidoreductase [Actinomycetota bacterium]
MASRIAYRLGLGWLLGHRVVLLEHRGRTTGRPISTALQVARWDPASRHVLVVAWSGPGTDWYRNVLAHPVVRVTIGRERHVLGCAVPLVDDEARSELERPRARRPWTARRVARLLHRRSPPGGGQRSPAVVIDLAPPRPREHRPHLPHLPHLAHRRALAA